VPTLDGIAVGAISTFTAGITNSGTIGTGEIGINVTNVELFGTGAGGNIINSGMISASQGKTFVGGINVAEVSTFAGSISNAGLISVGRDPAIEVLGVSTFSGGIVNVSSGTIRSEFNAIVVGGPSGAIAVFGNTSGGGVVNNGTITTVSRTGIEVKDVSTFLGGITNTGTISAGFGGDGIRVGGGVATLFGDIVNRGVISDFNGLIISSVAVFGDASAGGSISNTGTIGGDIGIHVGFAPVRLLDAGAVSGVIAAIEFQTHGGPNTLTLAPGSVISGDVVGSGSDVLQLGGTGSGSFDLSSVGPQYQGFSTFNVIGATWTASGSGKDWNVESGILQITSGGVLSSATVPRAGTLDVLSGGGVGSVLISGGTADLQSGATAVAPIAFVSSGGALEIGGSAAPLSAFMSGLLVSGLAAGDTVDLTNVGFISGATLFVLPDAKRDDYFELRRTICRLRRRHRYGDQHHDFQRRFGVRR
jgi:hypothetical protein